MTHHRLAPLGQPIGTALLLLFLAFHWASAQIPPFALPQEFPSVTGKFNLSKPTTWSEHASLLCTIYGNDCCDSQSPRVYAHSRDGSILNNGLPLGQILDYPDAYFFRVGVGKPGNLEEGTDGEQPFSPNNKLIVWHPYEAKGHGAWVADELVKALQDLICAKARVGQKVIGEVWNVGWDYASDADIHSLSANERPDVFVVDSFEVGKHLEKNALADISEFLEPTLATGNDISFEVPRQILTMFLRDERFYALPAISNYRLLLFNKTTLDALKLELPPPHGMTDDPKSWTWEKFINYSKIITESGRGYGVSLQTHFDEEFQLSAMMGRPWGALMFRSVANQTLPQCGLTEPSFLLAFKQTLMRMLKGGILDPNLFPADDPVFRKWDSDYPKVNNWVQPFNYHFDPTRPIPGFRFSTEMPERKSPEIFEALVPGLTSSGAGAGMAITSQARNKALAWCFISSVVDRERPYIHRMNLGFQKVPPYKSAWTRQPWNDTKWTPHTSQLSWAVSVSYPRIAPPASHEVMKIKPLRTAWLMISRKNETLERAMNVACDIINYEIRPSCGPAHVRANLSVPCSQVTNRKLIPFFWDNEKPCKYPRELPTPLEIECLYIGEKSGPAILFYCLAGFGIVMTAMVSAMVWWQRDHKAIKSASHFFCQLILGGCTCVFVSFFFFIGQPVTWSLLASVWLFCLGMAVILASLNVKLWRITRIFISNKGLSSSLKLTDRRLLVPWGVLVGLQVVLLIICTLYHPTTQSKFLVSPNYVYEGKDLIVKDIQMVGIGLENSVVLLIALGYNLVLLLSACVISIRIRNVPSQFKEAKFVAAATTQIMVMAIVLAPVMVMVPNQITVSIILLACIWFAIVLLEIAFFLPKLLHVLQFIKLASSYNASGARTGRTIGSKSHTSDGRASGGNSDESPMEAELREQVEVLSAKVAEMNERYMRLANIHGLQTLYGGSRHPSVFDSATNLFSNRRRSSGAVQIGKRQSGSLGPLPNL